MIIIADLQHHSMLLCLDFFAAKTIDTYKHTIKTITVCLNIGVQQRPTFHAGLYERLYRRLAPLRCGGGGGDDGG